MIRTVFYNNFSYFYNIFPGATDFELWQLERSLRRGVNTSWKNVRKILKINNSYGKNNIDPISKSNLRIPRRQCMFIHNQNNKELKKGSGPYKIKVRKNIKTRIINQKTYENLMREILIRSEKEVLDIETVKVLDII